MAKKTNRKLGLKKETVRSLDSLSNEQLAAVAGGTYYGGGYNINWLIVGQLGGSISVCLYCTTF